MPKIEYTTPSKVTNEATKELINVLHRHIAGTNSAYSTYNVERDRNKGLYTEAALAAQAAQAQESGRRPWPSRWKIHGRRCWLKLKRCAPPSMRGSLNRQTQLFWHNSAHTTILI